MPCYGVVIVFEREERESIGLTGHCDDCASRGHVTAHPHLGCSDVGCNSPHPPESTQQAIELSHQAIEHFDALMAASERLLAQKTAAALAVIGHAASLAGATSVSLEFTSLDRGYSLHGPTGERIEYNSYPHGAEEAINRALDALDEVDDRRPSLIYPYAPDLTLDWNTGEVNAATMTVAAMIHGPHLPTEGTEEARRRRGESSRAAEGAPTG